MLLDLLAVAFLGADSRHWRARSCERVPLTFCYLKSSLSSYSNHEIEHSFPSSDSIPISPCTGTSYSIDLDYLNTLRKLKITRRAILLS